MRLDKFLAGQAGLSRSQAREAIRRGKVSAAGQIARRADLQVDPATDAIELEGQLLTYKKHVYIMMHKPAGVVSATEDRLYPTVVGLLPQELARRGVFPAGRLDADTTGFVLLTDDGGFAHTILAPRRHVDKTYRARLAAPVSEQQLDKLCGGIRLADGEVCLPASARVLESGKTPLVELILQEGKYHQVKRMFAAVGNQVTQLQRTAIGGVLLDAKLPPGGWRELTGAELKVLSRACWAK